MTWETGVRRHDLLYLDEERFDNPTETAKWVAELALQASSGMKQPHGLKLLDVGCANGEFIYLLHSLRPDWKFKGVDVLPSLVERATDRVGNCANIYVADVNSVDFAMQVEGAFDVVTMKGVHSIFDDPSLAIVNCLRVTNRGGVFIIAGVFNAEAYDVLLRYRTAGLNVPDPWELGWNSISIKTVSELLRSQCDVTAFEWHVFDRPLDVPMGPDRLRTWTTSLNQGGITTFVNGLNFHFQFRACVITK